MRIAIFADMFLPLINGAVTSVLNLSRGIAAKGHQILIIVPKYKNMVYPELDKNIKILTVRGIPAFFYNGIKWTLPYDQKILKALLDHKIELLHFHTPMMLGFQAVLFAKFLKLPLIGTFHTFFNDSEYLKHAKLDYKIVQKILWEYTKFYYNRCNLITVPTESAKKILLNYGCNKKIKVISNGIDLHIFDNNKASEIKNRYNPKGSLCLFVGRIAYEKNLIFLIDAFGEVLKKIPDCKLLIVGGGPQLKETQTYIETLQLTNHIQMLGEIEHEYLLKSGIYGACDLFVTASKTETQGITVLEAQANGLPCVGIHAKGISDLIKNKINGFTTTENKKAFANAIVKILKDKNLLNRMKKNTLKCIKPHKLEHIIDLWEKNYQAIIQHNQKKQPQKNLSKRIKKLILSK